jgi:hypothetical protein
MVDILAGEVEDRERSPEEQGKDPNAVVRGRKGGLKGGKARAERGRWTVDPYRRSPRRHAGQLRHAKRAAFGA